MLIPMTPQYGPMTTDQEPSTTDKSFKYIGNKCRGDTMENLDFPDKPPPRGESHFVGRCVPMWDNFGNYIGEEWVTYCRRLIGELPNNCSRNTIHWLHARRPDGKLIRKVPMPGERRSVMKQGNDMQSYPEDPEHDQIYIKTHLVDQRKEPPTQA
jgi:hypothetical protein